MEKELCPIIEKVYVSMVSAFVYMHALEHMCVSLVYQCMCVSMRVGQMGGPWKDIGISGVIGAFTPSDSGLIWPHQAGHTRGAVRGSHIKVYLRNGWNGTQGTL